MATHPDCCFAARIRWTARIVASRFGSGVAPGRRAFSKRSASRYDIPFTQQR